MSSTLNRRLYNVAVAALLVEMSSVWVHNLADMWRTPLAFDDSYMFARYAMNVRHGLGISWNLDGVHTYGQTSLLWGLVVLGLSFLPLAGWKLLTLGSWCFSVLAVVATGMAIARNAQSEFMSSTWRVLPFIALPLITSSAFAGNASTGMETMLAAMLAAVFVGVTLRWSRGQMQPWWVAAAGLLLFFTRPEAAMVVVGMPLLLCILLPEVSRRGTATILLIFAAGVLLEALICRQYFHTAVPLSFYMKSRHAYDGYAGDWHPGLELAEFLGGCQLPLAAVVLLVRGRAWRMVIACFVPAGTVFLYLQTVTQIMGWHARYYTPYYAFLLVPALLTIDHWIQDSASWKGELERTWRWRTAAAAAMMLCFLALSFESVRERIRRGTSHMEYDPPRLQIAAATPLPFLFWDQAVQPLTDLLIAPLPKGTTVTATEVGYLGSHAPQVNVIDLAGLNDMEIALKGFDVHTLLLRKPDVLWMPNTDYTFQNALLMSSPEVLEQYDVYAGAANFGLGIRKDSPYHEKIEQQMQVFWNKVYPQYKMSDYLVRSATWSRQKHKVFTD